MMLIQSILNIDESLQNLALLLFLITFLGELMLFYNLTKDANHLKLLNYCSILFKLVYTFLGIMNIHIFWIGTILLYIYNWITFLRFRVSKDYDILQSGNLIFNFLFLDLAFLSFSIFNLAIILLQAVFIIPVIAIHYFIYLSRKNKALSYRRGAKESFQKEKYKEAWALLSSGVDIASKMSWGRWTYTTTKLKSHLESELGALEKVMEGNVKQPKTKIFGTPEITQLEIKKYLAVFIIISLIMILFTYLFIFY